MKNNDRSWTLINLDNFVYNVKNIKKFIGNKAYLQIVKADAYGHGAYQIAKEAIHWGAKFLGVANYQEGVLLRFQKIDIPILILSPSLEAEIVPIVQYNLTPSVQSFDFAKKLNDYAMEVNKRIKIHINVDTGMGRSGFYYDNSYEEILKINSLDNLEIEGIFSHFAASENDKEYTKWQYDRFYKLIKKLPFEPKYLHISNSSGIINLKENFTNLVRIGLLSFGIYTDLDLKKKISLKPVMSFFSKIGHIKTANKGESIGYNRTYIAEKKLKYAILPIGYADGYDFMLSNKGNVYYKNSVCKVLGKISMDMIAIDISKIDNPKVGDTVQLLGDANDKISAEYLTSLYNGSSYELLCQIGRRAKRYYRKEGKFIDSSPLLRRAFVPTDYSPQKLSSIIETAISHRIKSREISTIIYKDFLERFFKEKDKNVHYRENFNHTIEFIKRTDNFFQVKTTLEYEKILTNPYFYVICASNEKILEKFFLDPFVEYRWLLYGDFRLDKKHFEILSVKINDMELNYKQNDYKEYLSVRCFDERLKNIIGKKVKFFISTMTYYPANSHQLSVYINELTKNINISFKYNNLFNKVETVPFFSGKKHFPNISYNNDTVSLKTNPDEWIFPNSGVVFVY